MRACNSQRRCFALLWVKDSNLRPLGYEPSELPTAPTHDFAELPSAPNWKTFLPTLVVWLSQTMGCVEERRLELPTLCLQGRRSNQLSYPPKKKRLAFSRTKPFCPKQFYLKSLFSSVAKSGLEPLLTEPKSVVLPLHHMAFLWNPTPFKVCLL